MKTKICGITDIKTLKFLTQHLFAPELIGFIVNYPKSKRYVAYNDLKRLLKVKKKNSLYVAVLVKQKKDAKSFEKILEKIETLPFDYYQIYDCNPDEIKSIKIRYNKKIISAITVESKKDINKYKDFISFSDIILFDSAGYEKSISYDYNLLKDVPDKINKMIAGNIKFDDDIDKFKNICNYIDISGGLETSNIKDVSKIDIFLSKVKKANDEN
jgi:phosphoribosylanthranilate isomerase